MRPAKQPKHITFGIRCEDAVQNAILQTLENPESNIQNAFNLNPDNLQLHMELEDYGHLDTDMDCEIWVMPKSMKHGIYAVIRMYPEDARKLAQAVSNKLRTTCVLIEPFDHDNSHAQSTFDPAT